MQFETDVERTKIRKPIVVSSSVTTVISNDDEQHEQVVPQHPSSPIYSHNIQLYLQPPIETISLFEFETLALKRIEMLKIVETTRERKRELKPNDDYSNVSYNELSRHKMLRNTNKDDDEANNWRRNDIIAHFILRLAFCRSFEQKNWLIANELELFRFRFASETRQRINEFLVDNQLDMLPVSSDEKTTCVDELAAASNITDGDVMSRDYWKVPFEDALVLLRQRKVLVRSGSAYISRPDLVVILSAKLRQNMSLAMARAAKYFSFIQEDERVMDFIRQLSEGTYMNKDYTPNGESRITPDMIDNLSNLSFPLCMRQLHTHLRHDHHLRHFGRMQYGLFLKGIGLTLDDALNFWRMEFTKKIDSDKFDRQYSYNIRHMYGQEGKRADYSAFSCSKIILGNPPGPLDAHGCPFRHVDPTILAQRLEKLDLNKEQISTITGFSRQSRYDKACTQFFKATHQIPEDAFADLITHPNQYFDLSQQYRTAAAAATTSTDVVDSTAATDIDIEEISYSNIL